MFSTDIWRTRLNQGCADMGIAIPEAVAEQLLNYLSLLAKWNKAYNLSAIREPELMLSKHLLDSLSLLPLLRRSSAIRIIDVGTGGGLPGMVLALCFTNKNFTLLDSAGKKTRFLLQTAHELGLDNVEVVHQRVENFHPQRPYDLVVSRAFANIGDMLKSSEHLLSDSAELWAMKGVMPDHELSDLPSCYKVTACPRFQIPGDIGERCLLVIKRQGTKSTETTI